MARCIIGALVVLALTTGRAAAQDAGEAHFELLFGTAWSLPTPLTAQVTAGRRYPLARGQVVMYALPEAKITVSVAQVPLGDAGGRVLVPNVAVHLLAGLGVRRVSP